MLRYHHFLIIVVVGLLAATLSPRLQAETITVFLVRHAEKAKDDPRDPSLSEAGQARALDLAQLLSASGVSHLFASEYRRTQLTLAPLASRVGLEVEVIQASQPDQLVGRLRQLPSGSVALVAGHSNTVPDLALRLGHEVDDLVSHARYGALLPDEEYDRLYVLTLSTQAAGDAAVLSALRLRYGAASPSPMTAAEELPNRADLLVLRQVSVVPMDEERILESHTVVIEDDRIVALGPDAKLEVPAGATVVDAAGAYLMPALADMHVHIDSEESLTLFVANGVLTVRNMWGTAEIRNWQRQVEAGEILGPTIYSTGPICDGDPPSWVGSSVVDDADEAYLEAAQQHEQGYRLIKVYNSLTPDAYFGLVDAAAELDMRLVGHVPNSVGLQAVLEAGQACIEHLEGYVGLGPAPRGQRAEHLAALTAEAGTWNCVTLVVMEKVGTMDRAEEHLAQPFMRYVSPSLKAAWNPKTDFRFQNFNAETYSALRKQFQARLNMTKSLHDFGAGLLLGTDTPNPFVVPGFAIHDELAHFVAAGLSPFEALQAGTTAAAEFFEREGEFGVVAVGARADLLLLHANPLEAVENVQQRIGVVAHGRWIPEEELQEKLEAIAERYEKPLNPFLVFDPLEIEAPLWQRTYDIRINGALVAAERVALSVPQGGEQQLHAQASNGHELRLRLVDGEPVAGELICHRMRQFRWLPQEGELLLQERQKDWTTLLKSPAEDVLWTAPLLSCYLPLAKSWSAISADRPLRMQELGIVQTDDLDPVLQTVTVSMLERQAGLTRLQLVDKSNPNPMLLEIDREGRILSLEFARQIGVLRYELRDAEHQQPPEKP